MGNCEPGNNLIWPRVIQGQSSAPYCKNFVENELPLYSEAMPLATEGECGNMTGRLHVSAQR
jgi:hypothetical protein